MYLKIDLKLNRFSSIRSFVLSFECLRIKNMSFQENNQQNIQKNSQNLWGWRHHFSFNSFKGTYVFFSISAYRNITQWLHNVIFGQKSSSINFICVTLFYFKWFYHHSVKMRAPWILMRTFHLHWKLISLRYGRTG